MTGATNRATYGTVYLLMSETVSQSWWRPQFGGRNVDKQVCFWLYKSNYLTITYVFRDGRLSTYADPTRGQRTGWICKCTGHTYNQAHTNCTPTYIRSWASGRAKFPKMGDFLPRMPMNHRAKFDAANFILGEEIRNCTNKQNYKQ